MNWTLTAILLYQKADKKCKNCHKESARSTRMLVCVLAIEAGYAAMYCTGTSCKIK